MQKEVVKRTGLARLLFTLVNSGKGLKFLLRKEEAFQLELALSVVLIPAALLIGPTQLEISLMVAATLFVLIVETLNTAVEAAIDRIGSEYHELSGLAKDLGSLAVTLSLILWLVIWIPIVWDYLKG